jgi:hypothetical protein
MSEPTGRDRLPVTLHLTPGALKQLREFRTESGLPSVTEAAEAMIALAYAQDWPQRIRQAIRAQEATGYRR